MMRVSRLVSAISVALQLDGVYGLGLGLALWPVWSFLGLIGILTMGLLIYSISSFFTYHTRLTWKLRVFSSLYLIGVCTGFLVVFTIFFIGIVEGTPNFIPPCAFLGCFNLVTAIFCKNLQEGLSRFLFEDVETELATSYPNQVLPMPASQTPSPSFAKMIYRVLKSPPKTLVQLSSSYFKPAPEVAKVKRRTLSQAMNNKKVNSIIHKRWNSAAPQRIRTYSLVEANTQIPTEKCFMCFEKDNNGVFMECGHGGICYECAVKVYRDCGVCHICRGKITHVLKVVSISGGILEVIAEDIPDFEG